MCVAIAKPSGVDLPTRKALENCELSNRDGIGIAWASNGKIRIKKDFDSLEHTYNWMNENISKESSLLIHFRMATSGGVSKGLRHPFPVTEREEDILATELETDLAMIHNGVLWHVSKKDEKLSDTGMFIRDILAGKEVRENIRNSQGIQMLISGMIGESNKLAFLWPDGHILTFGKFYKEKEVLYSNEQFKSRSYSYEGCNWLDFRNRGAGKRDNIDYCSVCFKESKSSYLYAHPLTDAKLNQKICGRCKGLLYTKKKATSQYMGDKDWCYSCYKYVDSKDIEVYHNIGGKAIEGICKDCVALQELEEDSLIDG